MLLCDFRKSGSAATVKLSGALDETTETALAPLRPKLAKLDVTFDCGGIKQVNSVGFRGWLKFLKDLHTEATFSFAHCPAPFLEYASLLSQTAFANRIISVLVPYRCAACQKADTMPFDVDGWEPGEDFEERICPKCNGLMAAEAPADELLGFLKG